LTVVCRTTKAARFIPTRSDTSAADFAQLDERRHEDDAENASKRLGMRIMRPEKPRGSARDDELGD
jgi:hypothetical protein